MFLELIEYEKFEAYFPNLREALYSLEYFEEIKLLDNLIKIKKTETLELELGILFKFNYQNFHEDIISQKTFSILIQNELDILFLETEGNPIFRNHIINVLNESFKNNYLFFPRVLNIEEQWQILKTFSRYTNLLITTDSDIIEIEDIQGREVFPIYSSIIEANIDDKRYLIKYFNNGFLLPERMNTSNVFKFLNQIKLFLK